MDDVDDIFEVLNLEDFVMNDEIFLPPLLGGNEEEDDGEYADDVEVANLDPSMFLHSTYYSFKRDLENYFVDWCKRGIHYKCFGS